MNAAKGITSVKSLRDVIPNIDVLWSSGTMWHGIRAEVCHLEKVETAPFQSVDHCVVMHLSDPAMVELNADGQQDTRRRTSGDLCIVPATAVLQVRSGDAHNVLVLSISQEMLARTALEAGDATACELVARPYYRNAQLEHICRALKAEAEANYISGPLYGESLALAVCVHLLRERFGNDFTVAKKGGIAPRALRRVFDYIDSNLDSPLRMPTLAEVSGLSQYRFAHNFKSATGVPPYHYVIRTRLDRAKQMLRQTDLSVLEIAYAVGCQSIGRFNALFRRELGTTPTSYRAYFR